VNALFLFQRPVLAELARRAGALAGVEVACRSVDAAGTEAYDAVIAPLEALDGLRGAGAPLPAGRGLVVYARRIGERVQEVPEGALALELPFRAAELAAALERLRLARDASARGPSTIPTQETRTKILAADDDVVMRRLYERVLTEAGYRVQLASDGEEAWQVLPGYGPDLVLTDVEMPRLDGYGLCRRIREHPQWAQTPVIVCSSLSQGRDVVRAFESGTDDYLIKPILEDELLSRVGELLASIEQGGRETILVVDDSKIIRNLIARGLTRQGLEVELAGDGQEALERLAAMDPLPSAVISDFEMPRMGGFELGLALRQDARTRSIPLIMMSARDETRNRKLMKAAGAVAFLGKPFEPDKMVALVERVLAEERLKAEQRRIRELIADDAMAQMVREVRLGKRSVARTESMTLLFSDLKGFSTLCSGMPAPEVVELLNGYFDAMIPPIKAAEGDVDKFIGDAIMARFRDPDDGVARDPGPVRAIRAGLGMLAALGQYNAGLSAARSLHMRIGINYGEVVIGAIGSSSRRDYTTIGDTVNRAQRLESNASVDGILIAEPTYQLVKDRVEVRRREEKVKLKGIPEPVDAYDVLGVR
jgi:CheY-like chemotaxis protein/class 3 adenylate cyclase